MRTDLKGRGIGTELLRLIVRYAREDGYRALHGRILAENRAMIALARDLGFAVAPAGDDGGELIARLDLGGP